MKMKKLASSVLTVLFGSSGLALAAPVAISPALNGSGDGLNSRWVDLSYSPHNVDQALAALALAPGDSGYISEINQVTSAIDFADGNYGGEITSTYNNSPLGSDDNFVVRYTGFLNIKNSDTYTFNSFTDDGFRLSIGGENIMEYYNDRGPGTTNASVFLSAGLYAFDVVSWEQGGLFTNEVAWRNSGTSDFSVINNDVLFTAAVPAPGTVLLFGTGLLGLMALGMRQQPNYQKLAAM